MNKDKIMDVFRERFEDTAPNNGCLNTGLIKPIESFLSKTLDEIEKEHKKELHEQYERFDKVTDRQRELNDQALNTQAERLREIVEAWESLEGDKNYGIKVVEKWLIDDMKPAIDNIRLALQGEKKG